MLRQEFYTWDIFILPLDKANMYIRGLRAFSYLFPTDKFFLFYKMHLQSLGCIQGLRGVQSKRSAFQDLSDAVALQTEGNGVN